jgi:hypothetical protein
MSPYVPEDIDYRFALKTKAVVEGQLNTLRAQRTGRGGPPIRAGNFPLYDELLRQKRNVEKIIKDYERKNGIKLELNTGGGGGGRSYGSGGLGGGGGGLGGGLGGGGGGLGGG